MTPITDILYHRIKTVMNEWTEDDIYAVSFFVYSNLAYNYDGYENVSLFAVSYNTEDVCLGAGKYDEERWNYAFWMQNETMIIDPDDPDDTIKALYDWYRENGITDIGFEDDENEYDENDMYIGKGPKGHFELVNLAASVANRLQTEGYLLNRFGKPIPIIVHGLEYVWYDIEATKKANPNDEAKDFFEALQSGNI